MFARQAELKARPRASLDRLLNIPLQTTPLSADEIKGCLDANAQAILGYVVRWIDAGVGCSKVCPSLPTQRTLDGPYMDV